MKRQTKRWRRILFNTLTAISLLLALATAGLWVRSYSVTDAVTYTSPMWAIWLDSTSGWVTLERYLPKRAVNGITSSYPAPLGLGHATEEPSVTIDRIGLIVNSDRSRVIHWKLPTWVLLLVLLLLPATRLAYAASVMQNRPGLCPACGYDMRANPAKCSECGHEPKPVVV